MHITAESIGKAHRMGSCGQSESASCGKVCRRETSHVQVTQQKEMSLLAVAGLGVFARYYSIKMSAPVKWRQKGSRGGGSRKTPSTASGMDETKFPTKKGILALSGGEGIKPERAKIVPAICVLPCQGKKEFCYTNTLDCANFTWLSHQFLFHPEF